MSDEHATPAQPHEQPGDEHTILDDDDLREIELRCERARVELRSRLRMIDEEILDHPAVVALAATELGDLLIKQLPTWELIEIAIAHSSEIILSDRGLVEARSILADCQTERARNRATPNITRSQRRVERIMHHMNIMLGRRDPARVVIHPLRDAVDDVVAEVLLLLEETRELRRQAVRPSNGQE